LAEDLHSRSLVLCGIAIAVLLVVIINVKL
jgi:hypothetical protein